MRLIDVSVLKEWVENWFTKNRFYHPYAKNNNIPITELYDILDRMPTIERKTGKWERGNPFTKPRCSECGEPCFGLHGFNYTLTPYCPNCGARMER